MDKKEKEWEKLLRISTCGRDDTNADIYRYPYEPTPYCVLERLAGSELIGKKNVLLDYGCGKGRVSLYASYQMGCKTIGIEYDERLYARAEENRRNAVSGKKTCFLLQDAAEYEVPASVDRIFFFNPFSDSVLNSVYNRIRNSYYEAPREILLFFYFPSDEYIAFLMSREELEFYDEIDCADLFEGEFMRERILVFRMGV